LFISCKDENNINFKPIGYFSTKYTLETGAPRQGTLVPKSTGAIIIDTTMLKGLKELNEFEYIWVLYYFNKSKGYNLTVKPPKSHHEFGVFATRSPRRPNAIGLSLVKIDSIMNNKIFVNDVDAFNGTPILDIKPYLPSVDFVKTQKNVDAEIYLGHHNNNFITDSLVNEFVLGNE
jgi:tRNA-Thr(GGU) m(6)t(6)A37 methyltransferase TsaA